MHQKWRIHVILKNEPLNKMQTNGGRLKETGRRCDKRGDAPGGHLKNQRMHSSNITPQIPAGFIVNPPSRFGVYLLSSALNHLDFPQASTVGLPRRFPQITGSDPTLETAARPEDVSFLRRAAVSAVHRIAEIEKA